MNDKNLEFWIELFSKNELVFRGDNAEAAAKEANINLVSKYIDLIDFSLKGSLSFEGGSASSPPVFTKISELLVKALRNFNSELNLQIYSESGSFKVTSILPLLQSTDFVRDQKFNTAAETLSFRYQGAAALIYEVFRVILPSETIENLFGNDFRLFAEYSKYAGAKECYISARDLATNLHSQETQFDEHRLLLQKNGEELNSFEDKITKLEMRTSTLANEIEDTTSTLGDNIGKLSSQLENTDKEIREQLNLAATKNMWLNKARWNLVAFIFGSLITIGLLVGLPLCIYYFSSEISEIVKIFAKDMTPVDLPEEGKGAILIANQISKLLLLMVPIASAFWLVKLSVRFTLRSLSLMDDAKQRKVMLDTYLFLVGEGKADEGDRPLILNALFRPVPGHGGHDIEPPNLGDLMKLSRSDKS